MEEVIVYPRVSTYNQVRFGISLKTQTNRGLQLAKNLGYREDQVKIIEDPGVSNRKKEIHERPGMSEILKLIRSGNVKYLIVYDRDRLARKMPEHMRILNELKKYNVQILFSAENVLQFTGDLGMEASLALYSENEGNKIYERGNSARKFYPSSIFGYSTVGKGGDKRYDPKKDHEFEVVKKLFADFQSIETLEDYKIFKKERRKFIKQDIQKILTNGFYSAYLIEGERYIPVSHIPPIVKLETILGNREKFDKWGLNKEKELKNSLLEQMDINVYCDICGQQLSQKQMKGCFKYHCSHGLKSSKDRVAVHSSRIIDVVKESISEICQQIDKELLEELTLKGAKDQLKVYKNTEDKIKNKRYENQSNIIDKFENVKTVANLLEKDNALEKELKLNLMMQLELKSVIEDIKSFVNEKFYEDVKKFTMFNLIPAGRLLIYEVRVDKNQVHVIHNMKETIKKEIC